MKKRPFCVTCYASFLRPVCWMRTLLNEQFQSLRSSHKCPETFSQVSSKCWQLLTLKHSPIPATFAEAFAQNSTLQANHTNTNPHQLAQTSPKNHRNNWSITASLHTCTRCHPDAKYHSKIRCWNHLKNGPSTRSTRAYCQRYKLYKPSLPASKPHRPELTKCECLLVLVWLAALSTACTR